MIRHERLTVKAGEALQQAVGMAGARGNPVAWCLCFRSPDST
jgi:hypothetical protein